MSKNSPKQLVECLCAYLKSRNRPIPKEVRKEMNNVVPRNFDDKVPELPTKVVADLELPEEKVLFIKEIN